MSRQDSKKVKFLILLLAVLGVTLWLVNRVNRPSTTDSVEANDKPPSVSPLPAPSDARIRLDILNPTEGTQDGPRRDLFRYGQAPATPRPPGPTSSQSAINTPTTVLQPNPGPGGPSQPPAPTIPLQYQGFAIDKSPEGGYVAFLAEGPAVTAKHYNVKVGEVLMGRYRIARISDTSVEVEDLQFNRRQTLPVLK